MVIKVTEQVDNSFFVEISNNKGFYVSSPSDVAELRRILQVDYTFRSKEAAQECLNHLINIQGKDYLQGIITSNGDETFSLIIVFEIYDGIVDVTQYRSWNPYTKYGEGTRITRIKNGKVIDDV